MRKFISGRVKWNTRVRLKGEGLFKQKKNSNHFSPDLLKSFGSSTTFVYLLSYVNLTIKEPVEIIPQRVSPFMVVGKIKLKRKNNLL